MAGATPAPGWFLVEELAAGRVRFRDLDLAQDESQVAGIEHKADGGRGHPGR